MMETFKIVAEVDQSLVLSLEKDQQIVIPVSCVNCQKEERLSYLKIKVKEIAPLGPEDHYFYGYIYLEDEPAIYVDGYTLKPNLDSLKGGRGPFFGRIFVY